MKVWILFEISSKYRGVSNRGSKATNRETIEENQYSFLRIQFPVKIHTFSERSAKNFPIGT